MKTQSSYWRIGKSRVVHKIAGDPVPNKCHYFMRSGHMFRLSKTPTKPHNCSWCDECSRQEKKAKRVKP